MALTEQRESGEGGRQTAATPAVVRSREVGGDLYLETFDGAFARAVTACLVKPFEERHGVKVRVTAFGNDDEQLARIRSGRDRIDITLLHDPLMHAAIAADGLLALRIENIPNFASQHIGFRETAREVGHGTCYSSALVWGDTAICYNTDFIAEEPISWEDFFRIELTGRLAMSGSATNMVQTGALMTGQDANDIVDPDSVEMTLMELKPQLCKYWESAREAEQLFIDGEILMGNISRSAANNLVAAGYPVKYVVPDEGAPAWVDWLGVPKACRNRRAAEAFIDMALDATVMKKLVTEGIGCAPSTTNVDLTREQQEMLGATPENFAAAKFSQSQYVADNHDLWSAISDRVKSS